MATSWKHLLMPWRKRDDEVLALAAEIEQRVRQWSAEPGTSPPAHRSADARELLKSAKDMLERIPHVAAVNHVPRSMEPPTPVEIAPEPIPAVVAPVEFAAPAESETAPEPPSPSVPERMSASEEPVPPPLASDLIKLRDWLQASRSSDGAKAERVLDGMDRKLRYLLEREGFAALEETGPFKRDQQEILETTPTDDPNLADHVSETVRSGYLFQNALFRPQQIILYTYDPDGSKPV